MWNLAQTTTVYGYQTSTGHSAAAMAWFWTFGLIFWLIYILAGWRIFEKAGQAGWKVIIPIYSTIITLRIVGYSGWYILLFLIPIVNIVFAVMVAYKLAVAFGYGVGMTILEFIYGIGLLIIGWGDSKYLGPDGTGKHHKAAE